jgi:PIN domain nuclease of toxin-antitoxin system
MIYVLDASAMIAYLRDEPGGDVIERALLDTSSQCLAHAINLCEVFYDFHRAGGESAATSAISDLVATGVIERTDFDHPFWQEAGRLKARGKVSIADCGKTTLAESLGVERILSLNCDIPTVEDMVRDPQVFFRGCFKPVVAFDEIH